MVGATLVGIYDKLAGHAYALEYFQAVKNTLTDKLVIRLRRAEEQLATSSTSPSITLLVLGGPRFPSLTPLPLFIRLRQSRAPAHVVPGSKKIK